MRAAGLFVFFVLLASASASAFASASASASAEPVYVAEGLLGAKREVRAVDASLLLRPAWEPRLAGAGVRVGIVDTGIDATHPDLAGAVVAWRDFAGDSEGRLRATPYDDNGHGTHVAGVLAGRGHFDWNPAHAYWLTGVRGFAPGADLVVAKAMRADGRGGDGAVAEAILWCLDPDGDGDMSDGADVINLSVGITAAWSATRVHVGTETRRAVMSALERGVVVVVSSGNEGTDAVASPGDVPGVITVGALDRDGGLAAFTNAGAGLDVLAPGVLVSAYPTALDSMDFARDGYTGLAGTSMATPVVAGLVALAFEADPTLAPPKDAGAASARGVAAVEALILRHATPLDPPDPRAARAGVVDAYATLSAVDEPTGEVSTAGLAATAAGVLALGFLVALPARLLGRRARAAAPPFS